MKKLSITAKIWLSIGVFVAGFVLSTILGQVQNLTTEHTLRSASDALFPAAQQSQEAESSFQRAIKSFSDAVVMQDASGLDRAAQDGQAAVHSLQAVSEIHDLSPARHTEAEALSGSVKQFIGDARNTYGGMLGNTANMNSDMQEKMQQLASRTDALKTALGGLKEGLSNDLLGQLSASHSASVRQRWVALFVCLITIAIASIIVNLTIRRSITGPILRVIHGVQEAAEDAARASDEMAQSGQVVAQEAQQQASYIQETSSSLEEISTTTKQNASRAGEADRLMREAGEKVGRANQAMRDLTGSMNAISNSSKQVSEVLKSIDEIAFRTNILALNAAVEAARAGEAGAGFSVVADEVRSLAKRAAEAAGRSGEILEKTIKDISSGVQLLSVAQSAFNDVSTGINSGGTVVTQIAASSQEQAIGIAHVGEAISRIGHVTDNNVANAKRTAQAAESMSQQVQTTRQHLEELVAVVGVQQL
jgi:methyl-accepting chemotaxis protein